MDSEIQRLSRAAVDIAIIENQETRHRGGLWLQAQLEGLYDTRWNLWTAEERLDFMAVVKTLLDVIFRDAVEDTSDLIKTLS